MFASLLSSRKFLPLFIAQALGAFNDNAFKAALAIYITYVHAAGAGARAGLLIAIATGVFILPFFLFSGLAGQIADRHDKAWLARRIKFAEIIIMVLAGISLFSESIALMMAVLFLAGLQSTLFGPIKYGILPDYLETRELIAGNGLIEFGTFAAILLGTLFGGVLVVTSTGPGLVSLALIVLAAAGYAAARYMPPAPATDPELGVDWNPFSATASTLRQGLDRPEIFQAILGISWFWFLGAVFLTELPALARDTLGGGAGVANVFIAAFTLGIGAGSIGVYRLLRGEVSPKYVPISAILITVMIVELYFAGHQAAARHGGGELLTLGAFFSHWSGWRVFFDLAAISCLGGIYVVPLYALIQHRAAAARRARVIAANNIVNSGFIVAAAGLVSLGIAAGLSIPGVLLALAILNAIAAALCIHLLPQETIKHLGRWLFRLLYRVEVRGLENYRAAGPRAIIIANHQSRIDGALVGAFLPDRAHFSINSFASGRWWVKYARILFDLIEIDPTNPMAARALVQALKQRGRIVFFPEGRVTVTGALMKIYDAPAMIAHLADARIVPLRIDGAQYSQFSMMRGKLRLKPFPRITLTFLEPVDFSAPDGVRGPELREHLAQRLHDAMTGMVHATSATGKHLLTSLIEARGHHGGGARIVEDIQRAPLTYSRLITGIFVLGRALASLTAGQKTVGVLLPNAAGCLVTFFGLQAHGRIPAMLNYSTGAVNMAAACTAAQVSTILTSRRFIELGGLEDDLAVLAKQARIVYLEDVRETIGLGAKLRGLLASRFAETALRSTGFDPDPDKPAAILFTSGSEGVPKGVVLSHRNIQANVSQITARIAINAQDIVFNALPMFHAFGLTLGTILPVTTGVRLFLYPSPLHYKIVPELCYDINATIVLGTDTFLTGYARNAHPYDFYSARLIVAGAERVKPETRELWMEKFGLRIIEGYGATECSPVISANTPMHFRTGTVGRIFDGMQWRIEPVEGIDHGGRLVIKGDNVMLGYLRADDPGVLEPPKDGWYDTGDIVDVDKDGYVTILGRAKRFAKIGGEMVSLNAVEIMLAKAFPGEAHAVVSVPDARKGEKLVVLSTDRTLDRKKLADGLKGQQAIELMVPRLVFPVDELPVLGSGKTDYVAINRLARELAA